MGAITQVSSLRSECKGPAYPRWNPEKDAFDHPRLPSGPECEWGHIDALREQDSC